MSKWERLEVDSKKSQMEALKVLHPKYETGIPEKRKPSHEDSFISFNISRKANKQNKRS